MTTAQADTASEQNATSQPDSGEYLQSSSASQKHRQARRLRQGTAYGGAVCNRSHTKLKRVARQSGNTNSCQQCIDRYSLAMPSTQNANIWRGKVLSLSLTNPGVTGQHTAE